MSTKTLAVAVRLAGYLLNDALRDAEHTRGEIQVLLSDAISAWKDIEPVPCGHTGGWSFESIDGNEVTLKHECFYAHQYDLRHEYETFVDLNNLLEGKR